MGSETIAFDILLAFLCINGGLLLVQEAFPDIPLRTPFDTTLTVEGQRTGYVTQFYNTTTGTQVGPVGTNITSGSASNATIGGGAPLSLNPIDTIFFPLALLWQFIQFIGNLVPLFTMLNAFGFPGMFIFAIGGVIAALFGRSVVYWVWGR